MSTATVMMDDQEGTVEVLSGSIALEAISRAEIDIQISTAKAYPRSIKEFKRTALELATLDEETAASMYYNIPRAGKRIEGASVRMAEVLVYSWANIRAEADVVAIDEKFVTSMGLAFDLEKNTAARVRVKRRITDSRGKRYNDDMIVVTSNAANSIAYREAVFKVIPRSLWKDVYEAAKETSLGKAMSFQQRREHAMEWFVQKVGVSEERVLASLGRKGLADMTLDDLVVLTGIRTAIKDGELAVDDAFPIAAGGKPSAAAEDLNTKLKEKAGPKRDGGEE